MDVLVNNAGFAVYGMFSDSDWQKEAEMIQVNITTLTQLTKLFLKKMLEQKSGKIMNISSVGGFMPTPWYPVYAATKAYVLSFSEGLANGVKGTGVSVTCFCPGVTKTLFYERADAEKSRALKSSVLSMDAATAARLAYRALAKGKVTAIAGLLMSLTVFSVRFAPRKLVTRMGRAVTAPV